MNSDQVEMRKKTITNLINLATKDTINDPQTTKEVMREETELVLHREEKIFAILSIATLAIILITIKIVQK